VVAYGEASQEIVIGSDLSRSFSEAFMKDGERGEGKE
jgi:hypothetical protein